MWWPKTRRQEELVALAGDLGARFATRAAGHDRDGTFPHENFADLHASGYLALSIPREFGGGGASYLELALAQERLARGDASTALGASMHLSILGRLGWAVLAGAKGESGGVDARALRQGGARGGRGGGPAQLGGLRAGDGESQPGRPPRYHGLPGRRTPDGTPAEARAGQGAQFVITGRKTYTTMAPGLRFFLVSATIDGPEGPEAAQFLLERGLPGLSVEETWDAVGMRASGSHDLVLEAVRAPADSLLSRRPYRPAGLPVGGPDGAPGDEPAAQPGPSEGAGWGALIPAVYLGLATAAREEAVRFASRRKPGPLGGQAIGEVPAVQRLLGEIEVALAESRALLFGTTEAWLEAPQRRAELQPLLGAAKYVVTNRAVEVTDLAMRVVGGAGLSRSHPVQRYYRDVRAGLHHPPMDDVALATLARAALASVL